MIYFDTYHYITTLKEAGMPEKQAEALSKAQQTSLSECLDTTLASKQDVRELKLELKQVKSELKEEIMELRSELKEEIAELRLDTKVEIKNLESKVNLHSYMLGIIIAGIGTLILKAFF